MFFQERQPPVGFLQLFGHIVDPLLQIGDHPAQSLAFGLQVGHVATLFFDLAHALGQFADVPHKGFLLELVAPFGFPLGSEPFGFAVFQQLSHLSSNFIRHLAFMFARHHRPANDGLIRFQTVNPALECIDCLPLLGEPLFQCGNCRFVTAAFFIQPFDHLGSLVHIHSSSILRALAFRIGRLIIAHRAGQPTRVASMGFAVYHVSLNYGKINPT